MNNPAQKHTEYSAIASSCFYKKDGRLLAIDDNNLLSSNFQAIYSLSHKKPIGYEGLLRVHDREGSAVNPAVFFEKITTEKEKVRMDRLARYLHMHNFVNEGVENNWLFLNIHPEIILNSRRYGAFFSECIESSGIDPSNIVVEILENAVDDNGLMYETVQYYRDIGCKIAIDDFGAGASNIDRLWTLEPDIVKLDRVLVVQSEKPMVRRLLPNLVSMINECGSLTLLEGVETEEQALMAIDSGVDFVQGYYFAKPGNTLLPSHTTINQDGNRSLSSLCGKYKNYVSKKENVYEAIIDNFLLQFEIATREHAFTFTSSIFDDLMKIKGVDCLYILDEKGNQVGKTLYPEAGQQNTRRFGHVSQGDDTTWYRRPYFRQALSKPDKIHISRPYLSMTGGNICRTLSIALSTTNGNTRVYCCDIDWPDE